MKKIRLCCIGGGVNSSVGKVHFSATSMDNLFEINCGSFSRNYSINKKTGKLLNLNKSKIYNDWKILLRKEKNNIDAILIITPNESHYKILMESLKYEIPIICEKPIAMNNVEAKNLSKIKNAHKYIFPIFNYTGYPILREISANLKKIGKINNINIQMPQQSYALINKIKNLKKFSLQKWKFNKTKIPMICLDLGVHMENLINFILKKKPSYVFGNFDKNKFIYSDIKIFSKYGNTNVFYWFSKKSLGHENSLKINIFGEKGSFTWKQNDCEKLLFTDNYGKKTIINRGMNCKEASKIRYNRFKIGHPIGFIEAFANYYQDIYYSIKSKKRNKFVIKLSDALDGINFFETAFNSHKRKAWLKIKKF